MKYLGNMNFRISILSRLRTQLKTIRNQLQQKCIKKIKNSKQKLKDPETGIHKLDKLREQIVKSEGRLEDLKKVKADHCKLASVIILIYFLKQNIGTHMDLITEKVKYFPTNLQLLLTFKQIDTDSDTIINLLGYVRRHLLEVRGKTVEFEDLESYDDIEDRVNNLTDEEKELFKTSLEYYNLLRNSNPMTYQKVMISIKAILNKVESSKKKTEEIKKLKKEKIQKKKEAGNYIPEAEFKKLKEEKQKKKAEKRRLAKLGLVKPETTEKVEKPKPVVEDDVPVKKIDFKKSKEILNKKLKNQNTLQEDSQKENKSVEIVKQKTVKPTKKFKSRIVDSETESEQEIVATKAPSKVVKQKTSEKKETETKEKVSKKIFKKKQKTNSFKSYDQYNRKEKREEYKKLQETRPFRSYGVEGNLERRQRKYDNIQAQREERNERNGGRPAPRNQDMRNPDGSLMNRTQRRLHQRNEENRDKGLPEEKQKFRVARPRHHGNNRGGDRPQGGFRGGDRQSGGFRGGDRNNNRGGEKEWKAGTGNNGWGMDNMHPSWAAKRNLETQDLNLMSNSNKSKVIEL